MDSDVHLIAITLSLKNSKRKKEKRKKTNRGLLRPAYKPRQGSIACCKGFLSGGGGGGGGEQMISTAVCVS